MATENSPEAPSADGPNQAPTPDPVAPDDATWRTEIAMVLESGCFPARLADLAAHLVAVRAPSEMLWRLSGVNPDTRFSSLEALIAHIDTQAQHAPRSPREPM